MPIPGPSTDLNSSHVLQGGFVAEKHGGAVQFQKILAFEFAEGAADGFARAADELGDFFMSERQLDAEDTFSDFAVGRPIDQEARQLFRGGTAQANGADAFISGMAITPGVLRDVQAGVAIFPDVAHEFLAADKSQLAWL